MSDELREYYERELAYFRTLGAEFAEKYKKIAGRLTLGPGESKDPHVERLLQGMALLTARTRRKLDDDFPEIAEALLSVVYPHYLRPIPSLTVLQLALERSQAEQTKGYEVPRGQKLETTVRLSNGTTERCDYRTCWPLRVWPVALESAKLRTHPLPPHRLRGVQAVVHLKIKSLSPKVPLSALQMPALRFYLDSGTQQINVFKLFELLMHRTIAIHIAAQEHDDRPVQLEKSCLTAGGFEPEESLLPSDARTFAGYQLMTEFCALPEKHLFLDLGGLDRGALAKLGPTADIYFFLSKTDADLEHYVSAETFRIGCVPAVNLFEQECAPIEMQHQQAEYLLLPDISRKAAVEVYSLERVEVVDDAVRGQEYVPFYSFKHAAETRQAERFYHASWREAADGARDCYLALVKENFDPQTERTSTIRVQATCLNRNLPAVLEGYSPQFSLVGGQGAIGSVTCVKRPTPTVRPPLKKRNLWRLASHLSLNHLSLVEGEEAALALREILTLYNVGQQQNMRTLIDSLVGVTSQRVVRRIGERAGGFGQGLHVKLEFDESHVAGLGTYLFASVLDRFLALYVTINSFTELEAESRQRRGQEEPWKWPKRTGRRLLA